MKVYYFTAKWCKPCVTFGPIMEEMKNTFKGFLEFAKVDIEERPDLMDQYGIMSVPIVVVTDDEQEVSRFVGARDSLFVNNFLAQYVDWGK